MEKVKLVIWDLDETFWDGTLSESDITPREKNINIVKKLTSRGIINSICSKNDFEQAKTKLKKLGVWDYFVFPSISWKPKGQQVSQIIKNCQLRAENVLFLDDNHLNREEVKYYNENIIAREPRFIIEHIDNKALTGKEDSNQSRLKQYKLLERKLEEKESYSSNIEFLSDSDIKIKLIEELNPVKDRIHELISRTNQLNFTKVRLDKAQTESLINDSTKTKFAIHVQDKFGDYGIVGFVCYSPRKHRLEHFVFSCRILNLGVEQYIYQKLDYPKIDVQGEVAIQLDHDSDVDWIKEINPESVIVNTNHQSENESKKSQTKLLFTGSCELGSVLYYLKGYSDYIEEHTVNVNSNNLPEFPDHLITLLNAHFLHDQEEVQALEALPFLSEEYALKDEVFTADYDVLIYSVVANYGQNVYRHKEHELLVAWGEYDKILTDSPTDSKMAEYLRKRGMESPEKFMRKFKKDFEHLGLLSQEQFVEMLYQLRKNISRKIPIIFLNGAEINPVPQLEPRAKQRHLEMNKALDNFLTNAENCYLVDIRNIATDQADMGKSIRHFKRDIYKKISDEIVSILKNDLQENMSKDLYKDFSVKYSFYKKKLYRKIVSNKLLYNKMTASIYRSTIKKLIS